MTEEQIKKLDPAYVRMLDWRGIDLTTDTICNKCDGSGSRCYGSTATWHSGIGGQMITQDVCDKCWGSGASNKPWTNIRRLLYDHPVPVPL